MNRLPRRILGMALLSASLIPACGDDSPTDVSEAVVGTYSLQSVNGEGLPVTILEDEEGSLTVEGGTLQMRADRTYTETIELEVVVGDEVESETVMEDGTYTVSGATIQFNVPASGDDPAFSYQGFLEGNTLTYSAQGLVAVYVRN